MTMKKTITVIAAVLVIVLAVFSVYIVKKQDNTPPVINLPETDVVFMEGTDLSTLLNGVTATDKVDGDVSNSIIIEKTFVSDDLSQIHVYYAAKDKSNNVAKKEGVYSYVADPDSVAAAQSQKYNIAIINNLGVENLANTYSLLLTKNGHNVTAIGLSSDAPAVETVIYVEREGMGTELLNFFKGATIQVGDISNRMNVASNGANVFIVLGYQHSVAPTV